MREMKKKDIIGLFKAEKTYILFGEYNHFCGSEEYIEIFKGKKANFALDGIGFDYPSVSFYFQDGRLIMENGTNDAVSYLEIRKVTPEGVTFYNDSDLSE